MLVPENAKKSLDALKIELFDTLEKFSGIFHTVQEGEIEAVEVKVKSIIEQAEKDYGQRGVEELVNAKDRYGKTPLYYAIRFIISYGITEPAEILTKKGANVDARHNSGRTALHFAAFATYGNVVDAVKFLLDEKADVNATDKNGLTPLHSAAFAELHGEEIVELLVEKKANINATDNKGRTPLHITAENGYKTVAKSLVNLGADVRIQNIYNYTPLDIAISKSSSTAEMIDILRNQPYSNLDTAGIEIGQRRGVQCSIL